jgi:hypothetical protein
VATQRKRPVRRPDVGREGEGELTRDGNWCAFAGDVLVFTFVSHSIRIDEGTVSIKVGNENSSENSARSDLDGIADVTETEQKCRAIET